MYLIIQSLPRGLILGEIPSLYRDMLHLNKLV